jgi:hypothetical protein
MPYETLEKEIIYIKISDSPFSEKCEPEVKAEDTVDTVTEEDEDVKNKLIDQVVALRKQFEKIKKENKDKDLIDAFNQYNKIKDIGQYLLGYIAGQKNLQIKEYYEELGISDDEK